MRRACNMFNGSLHADNCIELRAVDNYCGSYRKKYELRFQLELAKLGSDSRFLRIITLLGCAMELVRSSLAELIQMGPCNK